MMSFEALIVRYLQSAVNQVSGLEEQYGVWIVVCALFLESSGVIFLPGETLLIGAGFISGSGQINPLLLLLLSVGGTTGGWMFAYYIGANYGIKAIRRHGKWIGITEQRLNKAHIFLKKYGLYVILFGRFIVPLRQLQGYISGSGETTFREFYLWNILGAILWVMIWGGSGYLLEIVLNR